MKTITLRKNDMKINKYNYLTEYINGLQSEGRYSFSFHDALQSLHRSENSIRQALNRSVKKKQIVLARKQFYIIVPPEYRVPGVIPAQFFIDDLMRHLNKPYYVGLLSAASLQGSSHSQPQQFQVITQKPTLRSIKCNGIQIDFHFHTYFNHAGINKMKTETGYMNVSNIALTIIDLVYFGRQIGGIVRAAEVIDELIPNLKITDFRDAINSYRASTAALQRLGYILDKVFNNETCSNIVMSKLRNRNYYRIALDKVSKGHSYNMNNRWNVIENIDLKNLV